MYGKNQGDYGGRPGYEAPYRGPGPDDDSGFRRQQAMDSSTRNPERPKFARQQAMNEVTRNPPDFDNRGPSQGRPDYGSRDPRGPEKPSEFGMARDPYDNRNPPIRDNRAPANSTKGYDLRVQGPDPYDNKQDYLKPGYEPQPGGRDVYDKRPDPYAKPRDPYDAQFDKPGPYDQKPRDFDRRPGENYDTRQPPYEAKKPGFERQGAMNRDPQGYDPYAKDDPRGPKRDDYGANRQGPVDDRGFKRDEPGFSRQAAIEDPRRNEPGYGRQAPIDPRRDDPYARQPPIDDPRNPRRDDPYGRQAPVDDPRNPRRDDPYARNPTPKRDDPYARPPIDDPRNPRRDDPYARQAPVDDPRNPRRDDPYARQPDLKRDDPYARPPTDDPRNPRRDDPYARQAPIDDPRNPRRDDPYARPPIDDPRNPRKDDPYARPPIDDRKNPDPRYDPKYPPKEDPRYPPPDNRRDNTPSSYTNRPQDPRQPQGYDTPKGQYNVPKVDPIWKDNCYRNIASIIEERKIRIDDVFSRYDPQRTNKIRMADFQRGLSTIAPRLTADEALMLGDEYDVRHEGLVNYQSFINAVDAAIDKRKSYNQTIERLGKHCMDKSLNFEEKLKEVDPRNMKKLTKEDFLAFLNRIGFTMPPIESNTLISELPKDKDLLDLNDLVRRLPKPKTTINLEAVFQKIKSYIQSRRITVSQAVNEFDKNHDGSLSPYELSQALTQMGITGLSADDITLVVQELDKNKDGKISLSEFSERIGMPIDQIQTSVTQDFFRKISTFLKNRGQTLIEFFKEYDTDKSNSIDRHEFDRMIALMRIELDPIDIDRLFIEIDVNRTGNITFMQFMNKFENMIGVIEKKDEANKEKIKQALKGKKPGEVFKLVYDQAAGEQTIPLREFKQGLDFLGCYMTKQDLDYIVQEFDKGKGYVSLRDFAPYFDQPIANQPQKIDVSAYQSPPTPSNKHWAEKYFSQIRDYATRNRCTIREAFTPYCPDRNGKMTNEELSNALNMLTMDISAQEIDRLGRELRRDGRVSIADISALVEGKEINTSEQIIEDMKGFFERTGKKIEEVFRVDSNENIYRPDLVEGLKIMNIQVNPNSLLDLIHLLNPDAKELNISNPTLQKVTKRALINKLRLREPTVPTSPKISARNIEERLKKEIFEHMAEFVNKNSLNLEKNVFARYDKYGTNRVSSDQFTEICHYLTERAISPEQLKLIIDEFDPSKTGQISYQAFIGKIEDTVIQISFVDKLIQRIKNETADKRINLQQVFAGLDPSTTGYVTFDDFMSVFTRNQITILKDDLSRLCASFDHDAQGRISYHDLLGRLTKLNDSYQMTGGMVTQSTYGTSDPYQRQDQYAKTYGNDNLANPSQNLAAPYDPPKPYQDYGDRNAPLTRQQPLDKFQADPYRPQNFSAGTPKDDPRFPSQTYDSRFPAQTPTQRGPDLRFPTQPYDNRFPDSRPQDPQFSQPPYQSQPDPRYPSQSSNRIPPHWADRYFEIIRNYMSQKRLSIKDMFTEFDIDRSNSISPFEFSQVLQRMGVQLSQTELQNLMNELDSNKDGRISITEFERILGTKTTDAWAEEVLKEIREAVKISRSNLRELFYRADRDRNNFLSYQEFMAAIVDIYPRLTRSDMERLAKYMDIDNDGRIYYPEFTAKLEQEFVESINAKVSDFIKANNIRLDEIFSRLDYTGDKCIHINQMIQALDSLRLPLAPNELTALVTENSLHRTRDNRLSYVDLIERVTAKKTGTDLIYSKIKDVWDLRSLNVEEHFRQYDLYNDFTAFPNILYEAISKSGANLSTEEYNQLLQALPKTRDGRIPMRELINRIVGGGSEYSVNVYQKIRRAAELKRVNLLDAMRDYDTYGDKMISKAHFKTVCDSSQIQIADRELDAIWADLDKTKSGLINYEELFQKIVPHLTSLPPSAPRLPPSQQAMAPPPPHWAQQYLNQVKDYIKTRNMTLKQVFSKFDSDMSNSVSPQEFQYAMQSINVNMPPKEMQKLINELDIHKDGVISLTEFEGLFPEIAQEEKHMTRLLFQIRSSIVTHNLDTKTIFSMKDREFLGYIQIFEFIDCIKQICPEISPIDLRKLSDNFGKEGKVYYNEFIRKLDEDKVGMVNLKVREAIMSRRISMAQVFQPYDQGDHYVAARDIRRALDTLNLPISPEELTSLVHDNNLSKSQDGRLSLRDLISRIGIREILPDPKPTLSQICEKIRKEWDQLRVNPAQVFSAFDYDGDMHLTKANFNQAFIHNNTPLNAQELDAIWEGINKLPDGRGSAQHLISLIMRQESPNQSVFLKIGSIAEQRRINLGNLFAKYDADMDKKITRPELEKALMEIRVGLTEFEYRAIFAELDRNREGKILIPELVSTIMKKPVPVDTMELQWAGPILNRIRESLAAMRMDCLQYFRRYNIDPQGMMNIKDFRDALFKLGVDPASIEGQRLVNQFSIQNQGKANYADFEWAVKNIRSVGIQPPAPQYRILTQTALDHLYQCLDFIGDCIKKDFGKVENLTRKVDPRNTGFFTFEDLKRIIAQELKTPSEEDVFQGLCLLLDDGSGKIPNIRFGDAVSGVRIEQVKKDPRAINQRNSLPAGGMNPNTLVPPNMQQPPGMLQRAITAQGPSPGQFQVQQVSGTFSQGPPGNQPQNPSLVKFDMFLKQNNMTIVNLFGRSSGIILRDVFLQCLRNQNVPLTQEDVEFLLKISADAQDPNKTDLDKLNQALRQTQTRPDIRSNLRPPQPNTPSRPQMNNSRQQMPSSSNPTILRLNDELVRAGLSAEEVFERYDIDQDGILNKEEFLKACTDFGFSVDRLALEEVFNLIDISKNGQISINEFAMQVPGARIQNDQRVRNLDLGQQFDAEINELFKMLDIDKDGFLNYNEITQGLKAYCIVPNGQQLKDMMRRIDTNQNGKIEWQEFKGFMEEMIKKNIMEQEDELQDMRQKFQQADFMKLGYLTTPQLLSVFQQMGCDITEEELSHLVALADTNHDGKIDIDEFMLIMVGGNPEVYNNDKASAVLFNIRKARNINPLDFLKAFSGMPKHFIPSFIAERHKLKKNLPSTGITPALDASGIQFRDISNTVTQSKLQSATHLKQNEIEAGGYIIMNRASGISIPDASIVARANILRRVVRIASWHTDKMDFIGNTCHVEAQWREDIEDRWAFELPQDKEYNFIAARIGKGYDPSKVFLIFEFIIIMLKDQNSVEFSCGFSQISYQNLMLRTDHRIPIQGGSPGNLQEVSTEDIRTYRKGWRHLLKMTGLSSVRSELMLEFRQFRRLNIPEQGLLESLPNVCVANKGGLQMINIYREYVANLFSQKTGQDFILPNVADPFLTQFPRIMDCPDTWMPLMQHWNSVEFNRAMGAARDLSQYHIQLINLVKKLYTIIKTEEFAVDDYQSTKFSYGIVTNRVELYSKRQELVWKAIRGEPDKQAAYNYKPFDVVELSSKTLIDIDFIASRKIRNMSRGGLQDSRGLNRSMQELGKRSTAQDGLSQQTPTGGQGDTRLQRSRVSFK
ncbi:unnamed protein product [Blepharisma stoltei]|uniref:EF-hand domain-containing protein n=1 Tax=Blepharisma stoltei TaxID=1481888 RepID=A0AAU9J521_9CILI|nr:unnamed protein product [Blepharisma stoltei]